MTIVINTEIIELFKIQYYQLILSHYNLSLLSIVINFLIYTYHYLVYYNTDKDRRRSRNMSVKELKVVVYVLKILTSLLLNRPYQQCFSCIHLGAIYNGKQEFWKEHF